ncbi:peptidase S8 [Flavobacterium sp. SOK18b]|uniref:S8 family peptidase n=1 Tax=Flavobacterium sp. SOK18b TaxID=797900 RepID=UPI0015FB1391|nr:S8 family peptidase [Flavobacterium sp. SOK18b]MBB1192413.1 peptidase S8 [Flavobacterium sp. SOK18b]
MKLLPLYYFTCFLFISNFVNCFSQENTTSSNLLTTKQDGLLNNWFQKDELQDSIPGISLDKWYKQNKKVSKAKEIIVAVIDTKIDLKHEDLQNQIWINTKEIANNGVDDDGNGYVDDRNGWNFLGYKNGGSVVWNRYEFVRIVDEWGSLFKDKTESEIVIQEKHKYLEFKRAHKLLDDENKFYKNWLKSLRHHVDVFPLVKDTLKHFFPQEDYTYQQLDSLYNKYKINDKSYGKRRNDNDKDLGALIFYMMVSLEVGQRTFEDIKQQEMLLDSIVNKSLSIEYKDRGLNEDQQKFLKKVSGNNNVNTTVFFKSLEENHSTMVSGIIGANRSNSIGIKGIAQDVKIMPIVISSHGDEHDNDIAAAIRYAVDNGAKVINMSFGKEFSLHKKWVIDAYKYAEKHNVLLVHAAGNNGFNVDENPYYPSDVDYENPDEVVENFITVGSISQKIDSNFVSEFSNYGKKNLDLFAPGDKIYTATAGNSYAYDSGTSLAAPMVSGTAALIWSYFPKLTAKEVKQIILESGTAYEIEVLIPGGEGKKAKFSELSKSGKVLNVYKAMELAEKVSKK